MVNMLMLMLMLLLVSRLSLVQIHVVQVYVFVSPLCQPCFCSFLGRNHFCHVSAASLIWDVLWEYLLQGLRIFTSIGRAGFLYPHFILEELLH